MTREQTVKEVNRLACKLHKEQGIQMPQACALAYRAVMRTLGHPPGSGLGQERILATFKETGESAPVKTVREAVSPWIWVISLASALKSFFGKK